MGNALKHAARNLLLGATAIVLIVVFFVVYQVVGIALLVMQAPGPLIIVFFSAYWPVVLLGAAVLSFATARVLSRRAASITLDESSNLSLYKPRTEIGEMTDEAVYEPAKEMERRVRQLRIVAGLCALAAGLVPVYQLVLFLSEFRA
ncbi:hypothetical protein [Salinibacterium sp. SWN248]|uniref:hypothetical protein n=1 Tax=Salinibacterium sp. SWN248 TaxID=2792056 RepID=UPI0018CDFDD2|nr:hypothetical protein [Salinibacterium sp. SWN248]MBH0024577.1 hypothetical protein [Salinibacterium sp. SWN248]